jgi:hypothetical protein
LAESFGLTEFPEGSDDWNALLELEAGGLAWLGWPEEKLSSGFDSGIEDFAGSEVGDPAGTETCSQGEKDEGDAGSEGLDAEG